jgi:hypothetical protein
MNTLKRLPAVTPAKLDSLLPAILDKASNEEL